MNVPDLNTYQPKPSEGKLVQDTKMLDTVARETADTVSANNETVKYVSSSPAFGTLGAIDKKI